jgi:outer membrane protein assembly factor BamB
MFHVKHRWLGALALLALATVATGCASIQGPEGWAAPAPIGGSILIQSSGGQFSLVNPSTGATAWVYPDEDDDKRPFYATPLVEGATIYVVDYLGRVTRLETGNGAPETVWTQELDTQVVATPLLLGSSLFVPTEGGEIIVLATSNGASERVIKTADRRIWGSPAAGGAAIYVTDLDHGATIAFDAATGSQIWEQTSTGASAADLSLDADLLLVGAFDRSLHALDVASGGSEAWTFEGDGWFMGRPLVEGNTVYAATMRGTVYAIDRATGAERWSYTPDEIAEFRSTLVIVDGTVLAAARDGRLFSIDASSGALNWSAQAVDDGNVNADIYTDGSTVYLLTSKHALVSVDLSTRLPRLIPVVANR